MDQKSIVELNRAFIDSPQGFVVVDSGVPHFAVIPYNKYKELKKARTAAPKKILVTGGAGYIGSHTVRVLQKQGHEVVVLDNLSTGRRDAVLDCKFVEGDLADTEFLRELFAAEKFDAVVHFAASIKVEESMENPGKYYENNVLNGLNLLNAMKAANVKNIIFSSTAAVYGEQPEGLISEDAPIRPESVYGETKAVFENILKWYAIAHGINSVSLRYFNAAGAWPEENLGYKLGGHYSHLIPRVLDVALAKSESIDVFGQDYPTHDGTCIRDYIHVLDLAEAHVMALSNLGSSGEAKVYNVGTGSGNSVLEVIDESVEVAGKMIPMNSVGRRPGDPPQLVADSEKIRKEFGWNPKHDLRSIIESSWEWHKKSS